jgi:acetoin utilization deacetylase AcuC-like enzyme
MLGFFSSPTLVHHDTGPAHPERPDRLRAIHRALRASKLLSSPDPFPEFDLDLGLMPDYSATPLTELAPNPADESLPLLVHTPAMIEKMKTAISHGQAHLDPDTPVSPRSWEMALLSLGCVIDATAAVVSGKCRRALAASRPPGHHAEPDRAMGFCLLSNVAIAARHAQRHHGVGKVAIVDFDVHHGNGTQAAFDDDPSVLFISLHQHPRTCYPGTGYEWEIGVGKGVGTTLNIPMNPGGDDADYLREIDQKVLPKLNDYKPELLILSAGFDAHTDDPLAGMNASEDGFASITQRLTQAANTLCNGRVVSALEGGYNLRALARSFAKHANALAIT